MVRCNQLRVSETSIVCDGNRIYPTYFFFCPWPRYFEINVAYIYPFKNNFFLPVVLVNCGQNTNYLVSYRHNSWCLNSNIISGCNHHDIICGRPQELYCIWHSWWKQTPYITGNSWCRSFDVLLTEVPLNGIRSNTMQFHRFLFIIQYQQSIYQYFGVTTPLHIPWSKPCLHPSLFLPVSMQSP